MNKKGISPVVAFALLLVVSVISVISFNTWYSTYSSTIFSDSEVKSNIINQDLEIDYLHKENLYLKNPSEINQTISLVKINQKDCNVEGNYSGNLLEVEVGSCINNLTSGEKIKVFLISNNNLYEKTLYFKDSNEISLSLEHQDSQLFVAQGVKMVKVGEYLLIPSATVGIDLDIFDISDKNNIVSYGNYNNSNFSGIQEMEIFNNYLYITFNSPDDGFVILNINDINNIYQEGIYMNSTLLEGITGLYVTNSKLYSMSYTNSSLNVFDVSDFNNINFISNYTNATYLDQVSRVEVYNNHAYITTDTVIHILVIIDVSNSNNLNFVSSYWSGFFTTRDLFFRNNYMYISQNNKFRTFDISNLNNVTQVDDIFIEDANQFDVEGNYAYVPYTGTSTSGVVTVDISNPNSLIALKNSSSGDNTFLASKAIVDNNYIYLKTTFSSSLKIIEIFN